MLSRRCVALLKTALRPDVWPNSELKLAWFDKILMTVESHQPNFANICTALELLSFLLGILVRYEHYFTIENDSCFMYVKHCLLRCVNSCSPVYDKRMLHGSLIPRSRLFAIELKNRNEI